METFIIVKMLWCMMFQTLATVIPKWGQKGIVI